MTRTILTILVALGLTIPTSHLFAQQEIVVTKARTLFPFLRDRRPETYHEE